MRGIVPRLVQTGDFNARRSSGESKELVVQGDGISHGQVQRDANWQKVYGYAFKSFLQNLDAELDKAGL